MAERFHAPPAPGVPALQVAGLNVFYGRSHALQGVDLTLQHGVLSVVGRNGMGKTTLCKAIMGLVPISAGSIRFFGDEITGRTPAEVARRGIGYVPQGRDIFPLLTVEENLQTGFGALKRAERYIPLEVYDLFPVLADMLRRRGGDLSGGQQQQLAIGRALVMRPKLLLLDEPTEGIQPSIIKDIGRAIAYLRDSARMAIVLVEQYFDFAHALGDRFVVMDRGSVVYACTRADMDEGALRRALAL
jgi:urea transport system ATP-binding protein